MSQVEKEIREQPEALSRLLKEGRAEAERIAARVQAYAPRFVVIAARGSSDNAARYAQYFFGAHTACRSASRRRRSSPSTTRRRRSRGRSSE